MRRLSFLAAALLMFTAACGSSSKNVAETPGAGGSTSTTTSAGGSYVDPYNTPPPATATTAAPAAAAPAAGASAITVQSFAFGPATLTVPAGTTVTVTNKDATAHTWTADNKAFDSPLAPGGTATFTLSTKGTFTYHCNIHPSMTGTVTVS